LVTFKTCRKRASPQRLWGGVRGGGRRVRQRWCATCTTPLPALPHKRGGSRPSSLLALIQIRRKARQLKRREPLDRWSCARHTAWAENRRKNLLVPQGGFEPSTYRLRSDCSAVELLRRPERALYQTSIKQAAPC